VLEELATLVRKPFLVAEPSERLAREAADEEVIAARWPMIDHGRCDVAVQRCCGVQRVREIGAVAGTRLALDLARPGAAHAQRLEPDAEAADAGEELDEGLLHS
jgi:hypothetical protein